MRLKNDHEHMRQPMLMGYSETYVKLASCRIIFINEDITDTMAAELSALLLYFDNEDKEEPVDMYINSNGGAISGLVNIYDVMQMVHMPIRTICVGKCYSAAAVLLAAGTPGERYAFENSSIMIHGIQATFPIPGHDMTTSRSYYDFLEINNDKVLKILSDHTDQPIEKLRELCKQDVWMSPQESIDLGLVDFIY